MRAAFPAWAPDAPAALRELLAEVAAFKARVLEVLHEHGPLTTRQLVDALGATDYHERNRFRSRLASMERQGLLRRTVARAPDIGRGWAAL